MISTPMSPVKPALCRAVSEGCVVEIFFVQRMNHYLCTVNGRTVHAPSPTYEALEDYVEKEWPVIQVDESAA